MMMCTLVSRPFKLDSIVDMLSSTADTRLSVSVMRFVLDSSHVVILSSVAERSSNFLSIIADIFSTTLWDISIARVPQSASGGLAFLLAGTVFFTSGGLVYRRFIGFSVRHVVWILFSKHLRL